MHVPLFSFASASQAKVTLLRERRGFWVMVEVAKGLHKSCPGKTSRGGWAEAEGPYGERPELSSPVQSVTLQSFNFSSAGLAVWPHCVHLIADTGEGSLCLTPLEGCGRPAPSREQHVMPAGASVHLFLCIFSAHRSLAHSFSTQSQLHLDLHIVGAC